MFEIFIKNTLISKTMTHKMEKLGVLWLPGFHRSSKYFFRNQKQKLNKKIKKNFKIKNIFLRQPESKPVITRKILDQFF